MKKFLKIITRLLMFSMTVGLLLFAIEFFDIPDNFLVVIMVLVLFLKHEDMFEKISLDLRMVEMHLEENFPEDFSNDDQFRRDF